MLEFTLQRGSARFFDTAGERGRKPRGASRGERKAAGSQKQASADMD